MENSEPKEGEGVEKLVVSGVASAAFILLFVLILWVAYLPTHSEEVDGESRVAQEAKLSETKAKSAEKLEQYAVANAAEGIYRIPIEQAMELTVAKYKGE